jgi:hypothetical protein
MTWNLLLAVGMLAAPGEFSAQALDGRQVAGRLAELDARQMVLETLGGRETLALETLAGVTREGGAAAVERPATVWVELIDDSTLAATAYSVAKGQAQLDLAGGLHVELPTKKIRSVRFGGKDATDEKLNKQWAEIAATGGAGDLLVTRKDGALDFTEGATGDVTADVCKFEVDGEVIPVKRTKVEGVIYFHPAAADLPDTVGSVHSGDGGRLSLRTVSLEGDKLKIVTPAGVELALPLEGVARFDFSSGKIAYLSDLEPDSAAFTPLVGFKEAQPAIEQFYRLRRDIGFDQEPLVMAGKTYAKGLSLASRSVVVYRLPGRFRLFKATLGIDDSVRPLGAAQVEIKADGKSLWQGAVRGDQPPVDVELDLAGAKRLEITVDYGDDLDVADRVDLGDARVSK